MFHHASWLFSWCRIFGGRGCSFRFIVADALAKSVPRNSTSVPKRLPCHGRTCDWSQATRCDSEMRIVFWPMRTVGKGFDLRRVHPRTVFLLTPPAKAPAPAKSNSLPSPASSRLDISSSFPGRRLGLSPALEYTLFDGTCQYLFLGSRTNAPIRLGCYP